MLTVASATNPIGPPYNIVLLSSCSAAAAQREPSTEPRDTIDRLNPWPIPG